MSDGLSLRFVREYNAEADRWPVRIPLEFHIARIRGVSRLPFELGGYGVNEPAAWSRLYGGLCRGYFRDFGWRAAFLGSGCE